MWSAFHLSFWSSFVKFEKPFILFKRVKATMQYGLPLFVRSFTITLENNTLQWSRDKKNALIQCHFNHRNKYLNANANLKEPHALPRSNKRDDIYIKIKWKHNIIGEEEVINYNSSTNIVTTQDSKKAIQSIIVHYLCFFLKRHKSSNKGLCIWSLTSFILQTAGSQPH